MPVPIHSSSGAETRETSAAVDGGGGAAAVGSAGQTQAQTQGVGNTPQTHGQETKTEQERENERLYEERMEEEYAKREGGA